MFRVLDEKIPQLDQLYVERGHKFTLENTSWDLSIIQKNIINDSMVTNKIGMFSHRLSMMCPYNDNKRRKRGSTMLLN